MAKGSQFERGFCRKLSLWWTYGERDDIFWRSSGSGARATQRSKRGKKTSGSYGDVSAIDPSGFPLLKHLVIELKRGYNSHSITDLIDGKAKPLYLQWIDKLEKERKEAGADGWMLIVRKDHRKEMVFMNRLPFGFYPRVSIELNGLKVEGVEWETWVKLFDPTDLGHEDAN